MAEIAQKHRDRLKELKDKVENTREYFNLNYKRFDSWIKSTFDTGISDQERATLDAIKKPMIEFNIGESKLSRLFGEFSKQEPSISVMAEYNANTDPQMINFVEGHIRHILCEANKDGCEYEVYREQMGGGFSVYKIFTDYANNKTFDQVIKIRKAFDPTMCGFDPLARLPHKGDANYCFELYPRRKEELEEEGIDLKGIKYTRNVAGFNWSYSNDHDDILLICDFYEKKKKRIKIVEIAENELTGDKRIFTDKEYKELLKYWEDNQFISQPPAVKQERWTETDTVVRYVFIENQIISYTETDYKYLPLVFVDGNSVFVRDGQNAAQQQFTRPYLYQTAGIQKLKNFAGQTLACWIENMVMHKWMAPQESIPDSEDYLKAWTDPQIASVFVYKSLLDNNPERPITPPREINVVPCPPEVVNAFAMADQNYESILGSYDASLGINDNQLSGVAIVEGATQSNSAAMPYIVNHLQALNQVGEIILDLIPKYMVTPRTVPIVAADGKKSSVQIKPEPGRKLYDENILQVRVEAGVNFAVQKTRALSQIIALMQSSQQFAQFMNSKGLPILLDNIEIRGIDQLKMMSEEWIQEQAQQAQQMQQQQQQMMQNNPQFIRAQTEQQKLQMDAQKNQVDNQLRVAQLSLEKQKADNDRIKIMSDLKESHDENIVQLEKAQTEKTAHAIDLAIKLADMHHRHGKELTELSHKIKNQHIPHEPMTST